MLRFFAKFRDSYHGVAPNGVMAPITVIKRVDDDPQHHARQTDGGLNYGAMPLRIGRQWNPMLRSNGGLDSRSMSSSLQAIVLPHRPVRIPPGRGQLGAIGARFARQGDRMYVPAVYVSAAPVAR